VRIRSLRLRNFRSYGEFDYEFGADALHLFFGENGSGKTNLIEAISFLSSGRSCLGLPPDTAVRFGETFFRIGAEIASDAGETSTVEYVFQTSPRRASAFFVNDVRTPLLAFIGRLPTVVFLPESLDLFTGSPQGRRKFLDALLVQLSPEFASARLTYDRTLKQRNALLKEIRAGRGPRQDLSIWNDSLTEAALPILRERTSILGRLQELFPARIRDLGERWGQIDLSYRSKTAADEHEVLSALRASEEIDIARETTTVGPHRDDWEATADGRLLSTFASRGQQRSALIALLTVAADLFFTARSERPIVLLDDVFSELDSRHQEALLEHLRGSQILLTSTHSFPDRSGLLQRRVTGGSIIDR